jgi:selenocysteine-specific elongation factor
MRRLILGTAGHIDHGKTALVRALTGTDTDRLPEEKRRGISIDLGFARLALPDDTEVGIVDVPGHEAFIRNMLAGATGIDVALLVVAADEGVMPQTREHTAILELLGVGALVVALTKTDMVDPEWLGLATDDVRQLLRGGPFGAAAIVPVSARTRAGLDDLCREIAAAAIRIAGKNTSDLFRLPIDRVFTVHGTGTVVTGTIWSGKAMREQAVRLLPAGRTVRVRALQSHGEDRDSVGAGERVALALAGSGRDAIQRGDTLVEGQGWEPASRLTLRLRVLASAEPGIRHGQRVRFHLATAEVIGRMAGMGTTLIPPGDEGWAQIRLDRPIVARAGDPFVIRSFSPVSTLGGGRVVEVGPPRRKRPSDAERQDLASLLGASPADALAAAARLAGWSGIAPDRLAVATPQPPALIRDALAPAPASQRSGRLFHPDILQEARRLLLEAVDRHHESQPLSPGFRLDALRTALPPASPTSLAAELAAELVADRTLEADGHRVRRTGTEARLSPEQQKAARALSAIFAGAGLAPPQARDLPQDLAARPDLDDLLHHLARTGALVAFAPGWFIDPAALESATRLATAAFGQRADLSPGDFRDLFGISRKFLIPLLEHFDRTGVTIREGDSRRLASPVSGGS